MTIIIIFITSIARLQTAPLMHFRSSASDSPRVVTYVNIKLSFFHFSLRKDIYNYRDISLISFFNNNDIFFLINIYSDSS